MNKANYFAENQLMQRLENEVLNTDKKTVILAGHYAIDRKGIAGMNLESRADFGIFPEFTMRLGCQLVQEAKKKKRDTKLILVVDDHSSVNDPHWYMKKPEEQDQKLVRRIEKFFLENKIPTEYQKILDEYDVNSNDFLQSKNSFAFQESYYRCLFAQETGLPPGCSGEYRMILEELAQQGVRKLISFIPTVCQGPTCNAIGRYNFSKGNPKMEFVHVYVPSNDEFQTEHDLWREVNFRGEKEGIAVFKENRKRKK